MSAVGKILYRVLRDELTPAAVQADRDLGADLLRRQPDRRSRIRPT